MPTIRAIGPPIGRADHGPPVDRVEVPVDRVEVTVDPVERELPVGTAAVDLYWLPLGAGASAARFSGRVYERVQARLDRRPPAALYHAALDVHLDGARFAIELTPVPDDAGPARGVVCSGAVGSRWLGAFRIFRYELRCWRDGVIPDLDAAVGGPLRLTEDPLAAHRLLDTLPSAPTPVWGRDELHAGEMWNSNSVISWLLVTSGLPVVRATPPAGGRAPGWDAGVVVARREGDRSATSTSRDS